MVKPCFSRKRTISFPDRREVLATVQLGQVPIDEAKGWYVQSGQRIFQPECGNIPLKGFFQVRNRLFFGLSLSVGGNIRKSSGESPLFCIPNDLDRDLVHDSLISFDRPATNKDCTNRRAVLTIFSEQAEGGQPCPFKFPVPIARTS